MSDIVRREGAHLGEPAYKKYDDEMIRLIGASIMPENYKPHELYQVLELAATYKLDPFTKELWAVRYNRNGAAGPIQIVVGRDGLLAIAERHPDFLGFRNQAVYTNDTFELLEEQAEWRLPVKGGGSVVVPTEVRFAAKHPTERGELLGAFAEVYRADRVSTFFWAPLSDYDKGDSSDKSPWRKMKGVMIEKVALVTALRHAYRVSGLYILEEMSGMMMAPDDREFEPPSPGEGVWYGDDEWVAQRLRDLFEALGNRYLPTKRRLILADLDDAGRLDLIARLERECQDAGLELPEPPPPAEGEVVVDASEADDIPFGEPDEPAEGPAQEALKV
jgi:phage recombination protein Bet